MGATPWTRRTPQITTRQTAALPQTADDALFRITGGKIRVLGIVGEVTTVIQNQANNTKLKINPSGVGADVDLCAVLDIANDAVGTLYTITGDFSDAMQDGLWSLETDKTMEAGGVILGPGDIELDCAASNTGAVKWTLNWEPVDEGANVAAA
jgi:hypothetical protein